MQSDQQQLAFLQLMEREEASLYRYVRSLVRNRSDADEVFQESVLVAWRKFGEFEEGTNFRAWIFQIGYFTAGNYRRSRYRGTAELDESFMRAVADERETSGERLDERAWALDLCLQKLSERERDLLRERYELGASIKEIARRTQRSVMAVYKAVNRIHHALLACVGSTLGEGDH
jgi:RNA polymerase sigma-70 factor (ECF subfamily)